MNKKEYFDIDEICDVGKLKVSLNNIKERKENAKEIKAAKQEMENELKKLKLKITKHDVPKTSESICDRCDMMCGTIYSCAHCERRECGY